MKQSAIWNRADGIGLLVPVGLVVATCIGFIFSSSALFVRGSSQYWISSLLADVIFLNLTHNAFTLMMLIGIPELKPWVEEKGDGSIARFYISLSIKTTALAIVFWMAVAKWHPVLTDLLILVSIIFPFHHALAQSHGLSLLYNRKLVEDASSMKVEKKSLELIERVLISALIGIAIIPVLLFRLPEWFDWMPRGFFALLENLGTTGSPAFIISISVVGLILLSMLFYPASIRIKKVLHATRYLLWSFTYISPFAIWSTKVVHGIEYLLVFRKMSANASTFSLGKLNWFLLCGVIGLAIPRVLIESGFKFNSDTGADLMKVAMSVSLAISFVHYYLDRQLFLMRKPLNRETVGRLMD